MLILKIIAIAIISTVFIIILKQEKKEFAFLLSLVSSIVILIIMFEQIKLIIRVLETMIEGSNVNFIYFNKILKVMGIAYIGEFGAEITRDAGENALAKKIEFATKIIIMVIILPVLLTILDTIIAMIP